MEHSQQGASGVVGRPVANVRDGGIVSSEHMTNVIPTNSLAPHSSAATSFTGTRLASPPTTYRPGQGTKDHLNLVHNGQTTTAGAHAMTGRAPGAFIQNVRRSLRSSLSRRREQNWNVPPEHRMMAEDPAENIQDARVDNHAAVDLEDKEFMLPCYKRKKYLVFALVAIFFATLAGTIGAILASSDAKDNENIAARVATSAPTGAPILNVPSRVTIAKALITTSSNLTILEDLMKETFSPQNSAWRWIIDHDQLSVLSDRVATEDEITTLLTRYVLATFYYALQGDSWVQKQNWLSPNVTACDWEYIGCDDNGDISTISTGEKVWPGAVRMSGFVPSEMRYLKSLVEFSVPGHTIRNVDALADDEGSNLVILNLAKNFLVDIPALSKFTNLATLDLSNNNLLAGDISKMVQSLSRLEALIVEGNDKIRGNITEIMSGKGETMRSLLADDASFYGDLDKLPFAELGKLEILDLRFNKIEGSIPSEIGLASSLHFLSLAGNSVGGTLPSEIGLLTNLTMLHLGFNSFSGTIPSEFSKLTNLRWLTLKGMPALTGTIPKDLCTLESLVRIAVGPTITCRDLRI